MIDYILNFQFNSLLGILLYWVPASFCAVFYTIRTWSNYQADMETREKDREHRRNPENSRSYYSPTDTLGTLVGRALVSIIPIANIWAAVFDLSPRVFRKFFEWIGKLLDQPLVPKDKQ